MDKPHHHRRPQAGKGRFPTGPLKGRPPAGRTAGGRPHQPRLRPGPAAGWEHVADWYDKLVGDEGSDYHRHVVLPAALRLLAPQTGERVLDLCCGQGVFCRMLAQTPVSEILGLDVSSSLIAAAKSRSARETKIRYALADARDLGPLADGRFDAAACLMAVHDVDDVAALLKSMSAAIRPGGRAVVILMHPCFRVPRQSSWGWDEQKKMQYRRMDRYATPMAIPIATRPGADPSQHTVFYHRPLSEYVNAMGAAGLAIVHCDELLSHHHSQPGGHSRGENRARQEFPVFLALKAIKL